METIDHPRAGEGESVGGYHGGVLLAIDSSAGASVSVIHDGQVLAAWRTAETNTHAEVLASAVQRTLAEAGTGGAELDGVVVGVGPGPFTGLRVGLALAHSLAAVWQKPLHGICSLDSLALRAAAQGLTGEFLAASDARRREIYWARYRADDADRPTDSLTIGSAAAAGLQVLDGPQVCAAAEAPALASLGAGVGLYPEQLQLAAGLPDGADQWLPDAEELALLAEAGATRLRDPLPLYLRESDARVPQQMKRAGA